MDGTELAYLSGMHAKEPHGTYANYVEVGHNAFEFILDFGQVYESAGEPGVHTRIITNPACAKAMLNTMRSAVDSYESTHGVIGEPPEDARE